MRWQLRIEKDVATPERLGRILEAQNDAPFLRLKGRKHHRGGSGGIERTNRSTDTLVPHLDL